MHARAESVPQTRRPPRWWLPVIAALAAALVASCTTVGVHTPQRQAFDFGPPAQLRVCVLQAEDVSDARVQQLLGAIRRELSGYGIGVEVPWTRPWQRPGFGHEAILAGVTRLPLEPPCDRLLAFVGRSPADALWGLAGPEVLGAVDDATHTRGFVVANRASLNQLVMPPAKVAVHEAYHLLGCPHSDDLSRCYARIARVKREARPGFFPGVDPRGLLLSREDANRTLRVAMAPR